MVKIKTQQNLATFVSFKFSNTFSLNLFSLLLTKSVIFPLFSLFSENFNKNSGTLIYDRSHLADNQTIFKNNPLKYVTDAYYFTQTFSSCDLKGFSRPINNILGWKGTTEYYYTIGKDNISVHLPQNTIVCYQLTSELYVLGQYIVKNNIPVVVQILLGKLNRETNSIEKEFCLYKPIDDLLSYQMINIAPSEYDFNVPITYCALKKDHEDKLTLYVETQHEKVKIPLHHKCFNYAYPDQIQHAQFNQNIFYVIFSLACIIGAHKFSLFSLYIKGIKSIYNSVQSTRTLLVNKYKLWIKTKKPLTNFNIFNRFFFKKLVK